MQKKFVLQNKTQIEDFVRGCTFFGTGGGGDYDQGVDALTKQLSKGNEIGWVDINDLDDNGYSCCPFLMGSIAPETEEIKQEREQIYGLRAPILDYTESMVRAIEHLEQIKGEKVRVLVPIELGGANTASCIAAAAEKGIFVVDGDYTGRAIPEIQQTTPYIFEKELMPITSIDWWENYAVIPSAINWRMAERIGKMISAAGYGKCAQAGFYFPVKDMKEILIQSTLSQCYEVGKTIREAVEEKRDPAEAVCAAVGGKVIISGKVIKKEWKDENGYYWGIHTIEESKAGSKNVLKIWFKNENHISWLNDENYITSPDMLQVIDKETGHPYTNNKIEEGMEVVVIAMKARPQFRTARGLSILSPKAFGFDMNYTPAEEIIDF